MANGIAGPTVLTTLVRAFAAGAVVGAAVALVVLEVTVVVVICVAVVGVFLVGIGYTSHPVGNRIVVRTASQGHCFCH
jgi:xanthosine utilization system XapX-like protein